MRGLWREYCAETGTQPIAYSSFTCLVPRLFKFGGKATDLCHICEDGKAAEKKFSVLDNERVHPNSDPAAAVVNQHLLTKVSYYKAHKRISDLQRTIHKHNIANPGLNKATIVIDFKENLRLGRGPREVNQDFYNRKPMSVLGFYIAINENGEVEYNYCDFLSNILTHDSLFASNCLRKVISLYNIQEANHIRIWTDCDPHFRSKQLLHATLYEIPQKHGIAVTHNFFQSTMVSLMSTRTLLTFQSGSSFLL